MIICGYHAMANKVAHQLIFGHLNIEGVVERLPLQCDASKLMAVHRLDFGHFATGRVLWSHYGVMLVE